LIEGQAVERRADPFAQLLLSERAIRRPTVAGRGQLAMIAHMLVERDLLRAMAAAPPALTVARLIDHDAVDPGAQGGLAAEALDRPEDTKEHFLRQVERLVVVRQEVQRELVDHPLMLGDQLGAGILVAGRTALDERRLTPADGRPGKGGHGLNSSSFPQFKTPPFRGFCLTDLETDSSEKVPNPL